MRRIVVLGITGTLVLGLAACTGPVSTHAGIIIDNPTALADQPVRVQISGLVPRDEVTITATTDDYQGDRWKAEATYTADGSGVVDLAAAAPTHGDYQGVSSMGLFWSMHPTKGDPAASSFLPPRPDLQPQFSVHVSVGAHGQVLAGTDLTRQWALPGGSQHAFTVAADGIDGELFLPTPDGRRHPAVLAFGGSEGGNSMMFNAALLASHGYPTLSLAYWNPPGLTHAGLPDCLCDIPLEYFVKAAAVLGAQPGVDPDHLVVMGYSRGTEAALLLANDYPAVFHGTVVYAPSSRVNPAFPTGDSAWTRHHQPMPQGDIPLGAVSGPLLAIAGADDLLWPSSDYLSLIMASLDQAHDPYPHTGLTYQDAGHYVGTFPYLPQSTMSRDPMTGYKENLGGTVAGNEAARERGWPQVLSLLAALDRPA